MFDRLVHCYDIFCILNVVDFRKKAHQQTNKQNIMCRDCYIVSLLYCIILLHFVLYLLQLMYCHSYMNDYVNVFLLWAGGLYWIE